MHEVTPDKFGMVKEDCPAWPARLSAPGRKSHLFFPDGQNPAVGYGNFVGISSEIFDGIAKPVEGFFYVGAPVLSIKTVAEFRPLVRIPQTLAGSRKIQLSVFIEGIKAGQTFPLEFIPQYLNGDKKVFLSIAYLMVGGEAAAGKDTMHMHVVRKFLIPCMENLDDSGCCAEVVSVSRKF